ncbi:MAG: hypothetical protein MUE41_14805, partial [Gemmatimonadaceae bacterium]|nr:hypothetical protein [Gemmatimonadaceae bacterium]
MTFIPLTRDHDATLHWRQPDSMRYRWVLAAAPDQHIGALDYTNWSGGAARGETATGTWAFEHAGVWRPRIIARVGEAEIARLEVTNAWLQNRASLVAPDGRQIAEWEMTSFLRGEVQWLAEDGARLITFRGGTDDAGISSWWRTECRVDFTPGGFAHPQRDLLLCIGWYLAVIAS